MHSGSKRAGSRENVAVGKAPAQRRFPGGEARLFAAASGCVCVRIAARSSAPFEAPPPRHEAEVLRAGGNVGRAGLRRNGIAPPKLRKAARPPWRRRLPAEKVGSVPRERHALVGDAACLRRRLVLCPASVTPLSATLLACGEGWFCAPRASRPCRRCRLPAEKVGSVPRERHALVGDAACLRQERFERRVRVRAQKGLAWVRLFACK